MLRMVRLLALVLGAVWFFPVSCTTSLLAAMPVLSTLDERHMDKGDSPHSLFFVVWQPGEAGAPFGYTRLADLARDKASASARTFVMTPPAARIANDEFTGIEYKVLSGGATEQLIEVAWSNGDDESVSRYRATAAEVTPVFSRNTGRAVMFKAMPFALVLAAMIYAFGRWLRTRVTRHWVGDTPTNDNATR